MRSAPHLIAALVVVALLGGALKRFVFGVDSRSVTVLSLASVGMRLVATTTTVPSTRRAMHVDICRRIGAQ